jgi:hypothetical protein
MCHAPIVAPQYANYCARRPLNSPENSCNPCLVLLHSHIWALLAISRLYLPLGACYLLRFPVIY